MSASDIIKELPKLSEAERRVVLEKLRELTAQDADVKLCDETAGQGAAQLHRLEETGADYRAADLRSRGAEEKLVGIEILDAKSVLGFGKMPAVTLEGLKPASVPLVVREKPQKKYGA